MAINVQDVVKRIARNTTLTDDALLTDIAQDAIDSAIGDGFTGAKLVVASGWLGSHMASLITDANSNVKKEQLAVMSIEYQDNKGKSSYLAEYMRMLNALDGGGVAVFI